MLTKEVNFQQPNGNSSKKRTPKRKRLPRVEEFMNLEVSHPYGILPAGNLFTSAATTGGNSFWFANHDEVFHHILSFATGVDLGRLAQTCRFLYAASHQPELWRDLVLRHIEQEKKTLERMDSQSWKDTFVQLTTPSSQHYKPHQPIPVAGVYSDYFYRLHSCRTFAIPDAWTKPDDQAPTKHQVTCVPASEMTPERFYDDFEQQNKPVLIRQAASEWKANEKDWNIEYLLDQTRGQNFRATSGAAPLPAQFSMEAYYQYCQWGLLEEAPLYLFDRTALAPNSPLWNDFYHGMKRTCPFWDLERCPQHDLFALLGEGRRPDHTWMITGPKRSGSVFHMDPNATHAWNAAVKGRKRWIFYPPGVPPPGVHPSADADQVALPLTVGEWIFQFWDQHVDRLLHPSNPQEQPLEITAFPGDVIFVPHGWWHMVVNMDNDMNIAITHNYASQSNLVNVLKFLNEKRDQVSGCRDRKESIKPDHLYEEFVKVMTNHHPQWLQEAQKVPHWTCRAWAQALDEEKEESQQPQQAAKKLKHGQDGMDKDHSSNIMAQAKTTESTGFSFSFL